MADVAYCMKCREKREFEGELVTMKNGRPASRAHARSAEPSSRRSSGIDAAKAMGWKAP